MAQQKRYYTAEEAAEVLGITPGEISQRRERNELRGLKDGATWKFKVEDINALAEQLKAGRSVPTDEGDVLASEVELGPSPSGKSGTIIGPGKAHDSDIQLAGSDVKLAGSDIKLAGSDVALGGSSVKPGSGIKRGSDVKLTDATAGATPAKASDVDELDMTLDEDLKLEDRPAGVAHDGAAAAKTAEKPAAKKGDSAIDLAGGGLDDDDVVLGGDTAIIFNFEARVPIWGALAGAAFLDVGGNFLTQCDAACEQANGVFNNTFTWTNFRKGVGPGLRYMTPVGPISLDYGFKLDRRRGESVGEVHFSISGTF
jgi:excisionase family DNA binding protein